jgi:hypothetical protein
MLALPSHENGATGRIGALPGLCCMAGIVGAGGGGTSIFCSALVLPCWALLAVDACYSVPVSQTAQEQRTSTLITDRPRIYCRDEIAKPLQ